MTSYKYQKQHASNYNYKPKRSFKQRVKNFFTIPEEDLKEEPAKQFEKIKLFTLTRGSLFLGILIFMMLINILVGFNINFLYLRQILGFLFLILVPGLLIMLCFKIRTVKFWEYLVYTVGLSVAFIMFAGLAVNWTLPALNITDKPLSLWPILICFNIFLLALWFTAVYRNRDLRPFDITIPKLDAINRIFFIIPIFFPLLSILGAFLLNNHGPNILTMIMLGTIAIYVLLLVIFRKRMNENVWPWALWMIGLALLFSSGMRSWNIFGGDTRLESFVSQLTFSEGVWSINNFNNAYNAMLSVSILPTLIHNISNLDLLIVLKLVFPILFSLTILIVYFISKKFNNIIGFLSAFLYLSNTQFFSGSLIPFRQEMALLFFGLMLLVLFTKDFNDTIKKLLFIIFGISMIVSHYSTSYIALALFTLTYIISLAYKTYEKQKIKRGKLFESQKLEVYLTGFLVLLLLIFGFLWYSQVTPIGGGFIDFTKKSLSNMGNMFTEDVQADISSPLNHFNIFYKPNPDSVFKEYINEINADSSINESYSIKQQFPELLDPKTNYSNLKFILLTSEIIKKLIKFLIIFGFFGLLFSKNFSQRTFFIIITFIFFILMLILPFISIDYSIIRAYQQFLILLSPLPVLAFCMLFKSRRYNSGILLISFILSLFFLFSTSFIFQISGGHFPSGNLNNLGNDYDLYFTNNAEIAGSNWLFKSYHQDSDIFSTRYSLKKLYLSPSYNKRKIIENLILGVFKEDNYIYFGQPEISGKGYDTFNGNLIIYSTPNTALEIRRNTIYSNGGSKAFR